MAKEMVKVYLNKPEVEMMDFVCQKVGETRSELLRRLLRNYLEEMNLIQETLHGA